jgi:hypothetical protein
MIVREKISTGEVKDKAVCRKNVGRMARLYFR